MQPTVPTPPATGSVPSTKVWLLLLCLLATLLVASHQMKPAAGAPAVLAGRQVAPHRALNRPATPPSAAVVFTASAAL